MRVEVPSDSLALLESELASAQSFLKYLQLSYRHTNWPPFQTNTKIYQLNQQNID